MVRRKLEALGYHSADTFDINDFRQFRALVLWLEDQVIRHYKIEDRDDLRNIDSKLWDSSFEKYCKDLECPIAFTEQKECLEWVVGLAVKLEYNDDKQKYSKQVSEVIKESKSSAPVVKSSNPLDNLDFYSDEFRKGVNALADMLQITPHPNHMITLEAICTLIVQSLAFENNLANSKEAKPFPIMESDLGFDMGDYILNQAAKVLRLLYIHDLRDLQTKINECIVAVQTITANPKTDTKLGKVGF
uniref:Putative carnitine deficiency associated protein n=1 Tax=Triatoma dimidiata TaxID=72491 RepID=A0A0V0G3U9_TRIDM